MNKKAISLQIKCFLYRCHQLLPDDTFNNSLTYICTWSLQSGFN